MKKLILLLILFLVFAANLPAKSYKFIAMDRYYNKAVPIDSIIVRDMKSGEDKTYFSDSIYLETITSIEDISANNGFEIYPNPVEDVLNLTLPISNNSPIIITDIASRIHFKKDIANQKISLNVAGLSAGIYNVSYGNRNKRFVKSSAANGSEISVLSSENSSLSLIKEKGTQSQFDYRFTVFCNGFQPNVFETKALSIDSTITLDITALPSSFDGKHIRVELYLDQLKENRVAFYQNSETTSEIVFTSFKYEFLDTIVMRGNKCYIERNYAPYDIDFPESNFDREIIEFDIDTNNSKIRDFRLAKEFNSYSQESVPFIKVVDSKVLTIRTVMDYKSRNLMIKEYLNNLDYLLLMDKRKSLSYTSGGDYSFYTFFEDYNRENSYIKIEIID